MKRHQHTNEAVDSELASGLAARRCAAPLSVFLVLLAGCATAPTLPDWTSQPARVADNGYIVYTGSGQEPDPNQAQLAAEGSAIQDLASECSFVPKGARVEDHFRVKVKDGFEAYARVAIDFQTCEEAQHALQPDEIRNLASAPFADELKRYQDLMGNPSEVVSASDSAQNSAAPTVMANDVDFFLARQYVYSQKQIVILAPPGVYVAGSVQTQAYLANVAPVVRPMQNYYAQNPRLRSAQTTWSTMEPQVRRRYPRAFKTPARRERPHEKPKRRQPPQRRRLPPRQNN